MPGDAVEFGCGYGTFTIPVARATLGTLHAIDIDPLMVAATTAARVAAAGLNNVNVERRDFVTDGCGQGPQSSSFALLFNILHIEDPVGLLKEALPEVLRPGGVRGSHSLEPRRSHTAGAAAQTSVRGRHNAATGATRQVCGGSGTQSCPVPRGIGAWCSRDPEIGFRRARLRPRRIIGAYAHEWRKQIEASAASPIQRNACTCGSLRKASRRVSQFYDTALAPVGIKSTQFSILSEVDRGSLAGPVTMCELATAMVMDRSTFGAQPQTLGTG